MRSGTVGVPRGHIGGLVPSASAAPDGELAQDSAARGEFLEIVPP